MDSLHKLASLTSDLFTLHADRDAISILQILCTCIGVHNSQQGKVTTTGAQTLQQGHSRHAVILKGGAVILTVAQSIGGTVTPTGAQSLQKGHSTPTGAVIPLVIVYPMHSHYNRGTFAGNGKHLLSEVTMKNYIVRD